MGWNPACDANKRTVARRPGAGKKSISCVPITKRARPIAIFVGLSGRRSGKQTISGIFLSVSLKQTSVSSAYIHRVGPFRVTVSHAVFEPSYRSERRLCERTRKIPGTNNNRRVAWATARTKAEHAPISISVLSSWCLTPSPHPYANRNNARGYSPAKQRQARALLCPNWTAPPRKQPNQSSTRGVVQRENTK